MSRRLAADQSRPPPLTAAERQRHHRAKVRQATAKQLPLLLSRRMRVRDIVRIAQRVVDQTDRDTARRIAQEIDALVRNRENQERISDWRLMRDDPSMAALILGIPPGRHSAEEILAAYRTKMRQHHPDVGGSNDHDVLTVLRAARDCLLHGRQ